MSQGSQWDGHVDGASPEIGEGLTRRTVVVKSLAASAGFAAFASGCFGGDDSASTGTGASGTPATGPVKKGGALRVGLIGGDSGETLSSLNYGRVTSVCRARQLYDPLVQFNYDPSSKPKYALASEITPSSDAKVWTVRIREGVTFHNGKEMTADDVIYTFQRIMDPKAPGTGASGMALLDVKGMKKVDKYTAQLPFKAPFATFIDQLADYFYVIIPEGYDIEKPIGSGPFMAKTFTAGRESTFVRNPNYWQEGLPYLDELTILDFADEQSQANALVTGELDVAGYFTNSAVDGLKSRGMNVSIAKGGGWNPITMRVDKDPFTDVRVRQAFQLIVDRQEMLDVVFGGHGQIGNDMFSIYDPMYDRSIPQREQDLDKAKSLLKAAGKEGLTIEMVTSPIAQGIVEMAQVFAQQAKGAGVTVRLRKVSTTEMFGPNYLNWTFSQDYNAYNPFFPQCALQVTKEAPYNATHYDNPKFFNLYNEALSTQDVDKRTELAQEMQTTFHDDSGYIIPFYVPLISGYSKQVNGLEGLETSRTGFPFDYFAFNKVWLSDA